jgi:thiamine-phosphate pyrophosphorylase
MTHRPESAAPFHLYLVTDRHRTGGRPLLDVVEQALLGGVDAVQLREKDLAGRALFELAALLCELCHRYGARLLVNDRIDIALAVHADGVHLPANSFTPRDARRLLGPDALIGVSTHSLADASAAQQAGADFIVFGPLFDTPSKRAFGPPVGLDALADVTCATSLPVVAIGGITAERAAAVRAHGAHGIAVIAAILAAPDPGAAARALRRALNSR